MNISSYFDSSFYFSGITAIEMSLFNDIGGNQHLKQIQMDDLVQLYRLELHSIPFILIDMPKLSLIDGMYIYNISMHISFPSLVTINELYLSGNITLSVLTQVSD
jgi:hypothetical protein